MDNIVRLFKALGDETRLKILFLLARKNVCAKGISKHLNISEAAGSQHIKILEQLGIVEGYKNGYFIHYSVNHNTLNELIKFISNLQNPNIDVLNNFNSLNFNCEGKKNCKKRCNNSNCERGN